MKTRTTKGAITAELPIPTVHLNGTSADALVEQLRNAVTAVSAALVACSAACPNGRDYYLTGNINAAISAHSARLDHLQAVCTELEQLWQGVVEQQH